MHVHGPDRLVADGIDVGATVVIDHTFRVAGSAGGIVQGNGIPLVLGEAPLERRVPFLQKRLVVQIADLNALTVLGIVHINHQRFGVQPADGVLDHLTEFPVGNHNLGLTMLQHESNGFGIQANIQGVQHRTNHGHAEMGLHHGRNVRQHDGNGVTSSDAAPFQGRGQTATALIGLRPGVTDRTMDYRGVLRVNGGGAFNKIDGRLDGVIGVNGRQALVKYRGHCVVLLSAVVLMPYSGISLN